jgi:hypothetical protein
VCLYLSAEMRNFLNLIQDFCRALWSCRALSPSVGVALCFARVKRYRPEKSAADADTIDTLRDGKAPDGDASAPFGGARDCRQWQWSQ